MQIWIYLNGMQQGPYSLEQLQTMSLDPSTPVWYDGLPQWLPASQAPATASMFGTSFAHSDSDTHTGYGYSPDNSRAEMPKRPATYLVWNILLTVLCCCPLSLVGIITGAMSSSKYSSGDYEGAKRLSNTTAWLLIVSIVWALLSLPFAMIMSLF